jgi:hypothetical protein
MTTTPLVSPRRRSWRQFGLGTVFLLVLLGAVLSWFARREMLREERRAAIFQEMSASSAMFSMGTAAPPVRWNIRLGALLRGASPVEPARAVFLPKGTSAVRVRELVDLFPTIQKIELDASDATALALAPWAELDSINDFKVVGQVKAADALFALGRIRSVEGIYFDIDSKVDDQWASDLAAAKVDVRLIRGDGLFWDVGDEGLQAMAQLPKLMDLAAGPKGTDKGLAAFRDAAVRSGTYLKGAGYTDASADVIASLNPHNVWLEETGHTDEGLAKMVTGPNVGFVRLTRVPVGEATLVALAGAPKLQQLTLEDVDLSPEQCDQLARLKLVQLRLNGTEWDDERLARFAPLAPTLSVLSLRAPNVTDAGLAWLPKVKTLNGLYLYDTRTTAKTWNALPSLATLRGAGLGGPHVDASVLAATQKVTAGNALWLLGPSIDDALIASPRGSFGQVFLDRTSVTLEGIRTQIPPSGARSLRLVVMHEPGEPSPVTQEQAREISAASGEMMTVESWPSTGSVP